MSKFQKISLITTIISILLIVFFESFLDEIFSINYSKFLLVMIFLASLISWTISTSVSNFFYNSLLLVLFIAVLCIILNPFFTAHRFNILILLCLCFLFIASLYMGFRILFKIKNDNFLRYIGFLTNIIVSAASLGIIMKITSKSLHVVTLISIVTFIILLISLVFLLPNIQYTNWKVVSKKIFYRLIIFPVISVFIIITLNYIFPNNFKLDSSGSDLSIFMSKTVIVKEMPGI